MSEFAKTILHGYGVDTPEVREFSARICKSSGILKKHLAHGREMYHGDPNMQTYGAPSLDKRLSLFTPEAIKIGALAAERAISDWGGDKSKITHLITYSTSGMTTPALDMQLIKALGLPQTVKHFWVSLMGCHAGVIGLRTASEIAQADATFRVLVVCVEINSAQAQPLNPAHLLDLNNHVVSIIFGDGAAGVVVGTEPAEHETPIFEIDRCHTSYIPDTDFHITARISQSGLVATLNKNVPVVVGQNSGKFVAQLLQGSELKPDSVNWAVHPGGKAVVDAVEKGCGLMPEQLRWTRYVLENYANMSSPTILFVLDKLRDDAQKLPTGSEHLIHPWTVVLGFVLE
uniref:Chalcone synthase 088 n=1 Tax=Pohlia nutans TaxID=140635 RepID=A0A482KHP5_9BRYO|nr:chalcone synthase 088 [Pohlia nutans]